MKVVFLQDAFEELEEAVRHYNGERPGRGYEFVVEFRKALNRIGGTRTHGLCFIRMSGNAW